MDPDLELEETGRLFCVPAGAMLIACRGVGMIGRAPSQSHGGPVSSPYGAAVVTVTFLAGGFGSRVTTPTLKSLKGF